jgi:hypothetical protein
LDHMVFDRYMFGLPPGYRIEHESNRSLVISMKRDGISDFIADLLQEHPVPCGLISTFG